MSDEEREPTPEQETEVRRLLAEARATAPPPADVAARLDRVLVGLGEERGGTPPRLPGHSVALASRRRRATILLAAAAAVVAIGVGLGQIVDNQGGADDGASSAEDSPDASLLEEKADGGGAADDSKRGAGQGRDAPSESGSATTPPRTATVGRVREASFTSDVDELRRALPADPVDGEFVQLVVGQLPSDYVLADQAFDCAPARWGPGVLVPAYLDGTPAVLAYRPVTGETQIVDLLQCGTGETLHTTTLPAR
jgi:hypothetical protein